MSVINIFCDHPDVFAVGGGGGGGGCFYTVVQNWIIFRKIYEYYYILQDVLFYY